MSDKKINLKSDVPAKLAFIQNLLLVQGFDEARITGQPADITARKGGQIFYFEIKFTAQSKSYFGAATLTEWDVALAREENYRFVIATMKNDDWMFRRIYSTGVYAIQLHTTIQSILQCPRWRPQNPDIKGAQIKSG